MNRPSASRVLFVLVVLAAVFGTIPSGTRVAAQQSGGLSTQAMAQISALTIEKMSRTPAQRKMDSQLVYAAKMARSEPMAAGLATLQVNLPDVNSRGAVLDVRADVSDALLARMRALGAEILDVSEVYRSVRIRVPLRQADAVAALTDVSYVQPKQEYLTSRVDPVVPGVAPTVSERLRALQQRKRIERAQVVASVQQAVEGGDWQPSVGSRNSEGDATHRAAAARATYGVSGAGVKVGVISDGVTNLAASQALGDLGAVTVLPGQTGSGDEGTAMLEIIHDLAPNAQLYFATAVTGLAGFAQNIRDLAAAGCTIIVDDVGYFVESPFQDGQTGTSQTNGGIVAQSVKDVAAAGVLYFSSAANSGNKNDNTSGTWEGDFVNGGAATGPLTGLGTVHNFGGLVYNMITNTSGNRPITLFWSDPLGASFNDYDLYLLDTTGSAIVAVSNGFQDGTQDPFEAIAPVIQTGQRVVVVLYSGAPRYLHLGVNRNRLQISTAGQTHGHSATSAPNSFGVAATPAQSPGPYPGPFNTGNKVETFSSDGPRRIFFTQTGAAITPGNFTSTGGLVLQKPDFTAADGVSVTGVGGFPSTFFGTSAAAPHAAAIAALVKSRNLNQTATQVRTALFGSAIDIEAAGVDRDSGIGILMADAAVARAVRGRDGDFDGDGDAEIAVFRPSTGVWYIRGLSTTTWGGGGDIPVAGDYDGDGKADVAVFRPSTGVWYILQSSTATGVVVTWGGGADIPVPGDYDGDGKTDIAVFRPSTSNWFIIKSTTGFGLVFTWGGVGDIPVARDFDGDGITDPTVFRPSTGVWYILQSSTATGAVVTWGGGADIPVAADYDGDGKADIAIFRPSTGVWFILRTLSGTGVVITWGGGADIPAPGDYDGDGKVDLAVFRPSTGEWFILQSSSGFGTIVTWGGGGDIPVLKRP